jgi:hypothetical protein
MGVSVASTHPTRAMLTYEATGLVFVGMETEFFDKIAFQVEQLLGEAVLERQNACCEEPCRWVMRDGSERGRE